MDLPLDNSQQSQEAAPSLIKEKRNSHISQTTQEINPERFGETAHIIRTLFHLCFWHYVNTCLGSLGGLNYQWSPHEQLPSLKEWNQFESLSIIFLWTIYEINLMSLWQSTRVLKLLKSKIVVPGGVEMIPNATTNFSLWWEREACTYEQ